MHHKLTPDSFLILLNNPKQPLHARNSGKKSLKKLTLFFLADPVSFNEQNYQKQESGTSGQLLFRLPNKFKNIPLIVIYYLTKFHDVMESGF